MTISEVRFRATCKTFRDDVLEHFSFKVLPDLARIANNELLDESPERRGHVLYKACFPDFCRAVANLLRRDHGDTSDGDEPIGVVTAYCNKYIQAFDDLPPEDFAPFIRRRIRDDFDKPLYYLLRVWLMWACKGLPDNCGDVLGDQLVPRLKHYGEDLSDLDLVSVPDPCASWAVPNWLVNDPQSGDAQYATQDLAARLIVDLSTTIDDILDSELKAGNGITALKAHAALRKSHHEVEQGVLSTFHEVLAAKLAEASGPGQSNDPSQPEGKPLDVPRGNVFRREGDTWNIVLGDEHCRLTHLAGLACIAVLLRYPGRPIGPLELLSAAGGLPLGTRPTAVLAGASLTEDDEEGDNDENGRHSDTQFDFTHDCILDDTGRRKLEGDAADLEERATAAFNAGDVKRGTQLLEQHDQIQKELTRSRSVSGRPRAFSSENEKARVNITKNLWRAYDQIRVQAPETATYLKSQIKTGSWFMYLDGSVSWNM